MGALSGAMIRKVYEALKQESRKCDFVYLVQKDLMEIDLKLLDEEIHTLSVGKWKGIVRRKIKQAAFQYLIGENLSKEKTKHIVFEKYQMRKYLFINRSTSLAKIIFSVRSGTLDIKEWTPWKYNDNICVTCERAAETMAHFVSCKAYSSETLVSDWENIFKDNPDIQYEIASKIEKRMKTRESKLQEAGLDSDPGSQALELIC